jgi:uncharacterized membrane protein
MWALVRWLYLMALIVWVGEVVFFSFVVAPSLFRTFPTAQAGSAVGVIFPTYYRLGYACGAVLLLTTVLLLSAANARLWWSINAGVSVVMLAVTLYAGLVIQPRATELRPQIHAADASQAIKDEFSRLHGLAVTLNGVVLMGGVIASVVTAAALRP